VAGVNAISALMLKIAVVRVKRIEMLSNLSSDLRPI
jgi:hypothetical protein